ncbi:MAG: hypothetical protein IPK87_11865 [Planctomycetes bacterium]|nr:hypothetical protein [Planctomycetota bacterium]
MAYCFLDMPADSSDLDTFQGYFVARAPRVAKGGPIRRPSDELLLNLPPAGSVRPYPEPVEYRRGKRVVVLARHQTPLAPNYLLASWLAVPALCGALVWMIGMMGW